MRSLIGIAMLPGVPHQGIHTAVDPRRTDCLTRIGPDSCSHAARYSAYLPQSCSLPCASSGRPEVLSPRAVVGTTHDPPMSTTARHLISPRGYRTLQLGSDKARSDEARFLIAPV